MDLFFGLQGNVWSLLVSSHSERSNPQDKNGSYSSISHHGMLLVFTHIWQVVSEAPACEDSTHSILTSWHLITVTKGGAIALWSVTVTRHSDSHTYLVHDCALPGWAWGHFFVRFMERKDTIMLRRIT